MKKGEERRRWHSRSSKCPGEAVPGMTSRNAGCQLATLLLGALVLEAERKPHQDPLLPIKGSSEVSKLSVQQDESDLGRNIYSALVGKIYFKTKPPLHTS